MPARRLQCWLVMHCLVALSRHFERQSSFVYWCFQAVLPRGDTHLYYDDKSVPRKDIQPPGLWLAKRLAG